MAQPKANPKKTSKKVEWICDICNKDKTHPKNAIFRIAEYKELICDECYDRGLLWSIKEAYNWRAQVRIDAVRKSVNDE